MVPMKISRKFFDQLHSSTNPIFASYLLTNSLRPFMKSITPSLSDCLCEFFHRKILHKNRLRPRANCPDSLSPKRLVCSEWHNDIGNSGSQTSRRGPCATMMHYHFA